MCCGPADWKREEVPDHKFDFIDVRDYHNNGWWTRTRYGLLFALVIKSFAVYIADIYTAVTLLAFNHFNGNIYNRVQDSDQNTVKVPIQYGKWIFFGCIIFSFLLLAYEAHKTRNIIRSRDISYAYTNVMANNYYSLRSYDHFCLFSQINNSTKKKDEIAFFIFFTFKGWKRLIVADGPRQVINGLTLYGLIEVSNFSTNVSDYYGGNIFTGIMLLTMIFTVVIFAGSAILLLIASLMYLPLLCYIKGNLKEYCCHKIDKRITELVRVKKKERVARQAAIARAEAKGDFKHLMNKKGIIVGQKIQQPTLPQVDIDLLASEKAPSSPNMAALRRQGTGTTSNHNNNPYGYGEDYGSQAHLVLNQGYGGGGSESYHHNMKGSTDDFNGVAPSLPPSSHTSPDAYPLHVRGNTLAGSSSNLDVTSAGSMMAQLGPIGTSPQLFAQRNVGNNTNNHSTMDSVNADATGSTLRSPETHPVYHHGRSTSPYSRSPLGQQPQQNSGYEYDQGEYDQHQQYEHQQQYDDHHQQYDQQQQDYSHDQQEQGGYTQQTQAYTGDLSSYAPYQQQPQEGYTDENGYAYGYDHQGYDYSQQQQYDYNNQQQQYDYNHDGYTNQYHNGYPQQHVDYGHRQQQDSIARDY
ncbi:unnamed protein product [Sympodiomycopsis kandeliae]